MPANEFFMSYLDWRKDAAGCATFLRQAFARMERERTVKTVFYDGTVTDADGFAAELCRPGSLPFGLFWNGEAAGIAWLNSIEGKSARLHFGMFRAVWGKGRPIRIGRRMYETLLNFHDEQGFLFDVIVGLTPKRNVLAWKGAAAAGARVVGIVPHGVWMRWLGRSEDAVLTAATRESLGEGMEESTCL